MVDGVLAPAAFFGRLPRLLTSLDSGDLVLPNFGVFLETTKFKWVAAVFLYIGTPG